MFSALKKLTSGNNKNEISPVKNTPGGLQTMHASLQKKFAKGVHYNMKIIIRGDRNVGKTCLFHRLQGKGFLEEYNPTQEIQVASIHWNYKATDDIVKVEVWDVVDKGKKKKPLEGLKLNTSTVPLPEEPALDAEFLDVYKGTNGVIMMLDITKQWTFEYVRRELPKVPTSIPVIVLANHRDMGHHRCVSEDDVKFFIESLNRKPTDAQIRYGESSMRNSFGLKLLHKFFNLPFLALQRDSLLKQLETNKKEMDLTNEELNLYLETDDADYDKFLDLLTQRRRQNADALSVSATANASPAPVANAPVARAPAKPVTPQPYTKVGDNSTPLTSPRDENMTKESANVSSIEDFVAESEMNDKDLEFLSSVEETNNLPKSAGNNFDSESEEEPVGNPMVMGFQDEIDDEDLLHHSSSAQPAVQVSDSSEEEPEESLKPLPVQLFPRRTVEESQPAFDAEDELDDWLNEPADHPIQTQHANSKNPNLEHEVTAATNQVCLDGKFESLVESAPEETEAKSTKKNKEKKGKRKSKKSKKERNSTDGEEISDFQPARPIDDYEEI